MDLEKKFIVLENFIVFEGIDGAGTTTQIKRIVQSDEKTYLATAEPTNNETGKFLRRMLSGEFSVDEKTATYLFAADRCEHIFGKGGVIEMLNKGKIVLSDRYIFSSLAYQSIFCGKELPEHVNSPFPLPQILFYFDISAEEALKRVEQRSEKKEIYEKLELQKKIAAQYDKIIKEYEEKNSGMHIVHIDATLPIEEITKQIRAKIFLYTMS